MTSQAAGEGKQPGRHPSPAPQQCPLGDDCDIDIDHDHDPISTWARLVIRSLDEKDVS